MILSVSFVLQSILAVIIGLVFGFVLVFLIYTFIVLKSISDFDLEGFLFKDELNKKIIEFKKTKKELGSLINNSIKYSNELVLFIAKSFFPDSSEPFLELSIKEVLELSKEITNRVDLILDKKALRLIKRLRISDLIKISVIKKKLDNNLLMKINKKFKISTRFSFLNGIFNFINPIYWIKKILMDFVITLIVRKICIKVIEISCIETYKAFNKAKEC